jgi:FKBP-type peptidyl-prolyl cis-trans isomerase FkpA
MIRMKGIFRGIVFFPVMALFIFACGEKDDNLQKEKEMRLLRQYLESHNIDKEPESSGIYYISLGEGQGIRPERNDWVIINYTARTINDRIFDTTDEEVARRNNIYSSSVIYGDRRMDLNLLGLKGVLEGLLLMKENEAARLIIPSHLAYGSSGTGLIPPYSTIIYDIELVRVIRDPEVYEQELIDNYTGLYIDSTHLSVQHLNGIYFIELGQGTGETYPGEGDIARLYYRGTFTDGRVFDSNTGGNTLNITIGGKSVVPGFEEGVKLMKEEGRARIVLPSSLAYGPAGSGASIPGYTPLVFEVELVELQVKEE